MENNIETTEELTPAKKTKKVELTELEAGIQSRRADLNFPALQAFYGLTETELKTILDKLPPIEDCNC
jgi:hypothetical protein